MAEELQELPVVEQPEEAQPLVRTTLTLDGKLYRRMYGRLTAGIRVVFGCGVALLVLWIVASALENGGAFSEIFSDDLYLWLPVIIIVCSAVYLICMWKMRRDANANVRENAYCFYPDTFTIETTQGGRPMGLSRLAYSDCRKIKENKSFFFLTVPAAGIFVVEKAGLSAEDCARLRELFRLPPKSSERK